MSLTDSQSLLAILFVFHILFVVFRSQTPCLTTRLSVSAGILSAVAVLAAGIQSFLEDQRSLKPSDILVLYFSASIILYLPLLRSLWLIPYGILSRAIWTATLICTVAVVFVESAQKTKFLRPQYKNVTAEQMTGFWGRSFFIWILPFFQSGYSRILQLDDIAHVDDDLQEKCTSMRLDTSWEQIRGRYRLLRATFRANMWPCISAILPRLALSAFNLCQPFLIKAAVLHMSTQTEKSNENYGQALVGAFVLVYVGIAVSK